MLDDLVKLHNLITQQIDTLEFKAKVDAADPCQMIQLLLQKVQVEKWLEEERAKPRVQYRNYGVNEYRRTQQLPEPERLTHRHFGNGRRLCQADDETLKADINLSKLDVEITCRECKKVMTRRLSYFANLPSTGRIMHKTDSDESVLCGAEPFEEMYNTMWDSEVNCSHCRSIIHYNHRNGN